MIRRTIVVNNVEPAMLSARIPLGVNLDFAVTMKNLRGEFIDQALLFPQFVLMPRSRGGIYPYDMTIDPANNNSRAQVAGTQLTDPSGYNLEIYSRQDDPRLPIGLLAKGHLATEGSAYNQSGPMNMINIPTVVGPPGPPGLAGTRGSIWFTGNGDPSPVAFSALTGDMYLDEDTGNVWRYANGAWVLGAG